MARCFAQYSEFLSTGPLPFNATQIINSFFNSRFSANHIKDRDSTNREILTPPNVPLHCVESI